MKKFPLVLSALFAFSAIGACAVEALPEITAIDEVPAPPLDAPAADDGN